jgi:prepilin-type N-terminal cleavage/methylation domain-containing protein
MCTAPKSEFSRNQRSVAVDWQDCGWCPVIAVQSRWGEAPDEPSLRRFGMPGPAREDRPLLGFRLRTAPTRQVGATGARPTGTANQAIIRSLVIKPLPVPSLFRPLRRHLVSLKTMKNDPYRSSRFRAGFTIVELLTVISIIAILAAMLLPVLAAAKKHAQKVQAKTEIQGIVTAIEAYDSAYGRFPVSSFAQTNANPDFTYGFQTPDGSSKVVIFVGSLTVVSNAEVIAILMDNTNLANGVNAGHVKNPQQTIFLNAKMSGYDPSQPGQPEGGVDVTGVYRDPWGNPYVITLDLNYDENCKDSFYCWDAVSSATLPPTSVNPGLNGLMTDGTANNFQYHGKVMVWSAGPDGKIDNTVNANSGANKDNILSWQ